MGVDSGRCGVLGVEVPQSSLSFLAVCTPAGGLAGVGWRGQPILSCASSRLQRNQTVTRRTPRCTLSPAFLFAFKTVLGVVPSPAGYRCRGTTGFDGQPLQAGADLCGRGGVGSGTGALSTGFAHYGKIGGTKPGRCTGASGFGGFASGDGGDSRTVGRIKARLAVTEPVEVRHIRRRSAFCAGFSNKAPVPPRHKRRAVAADQIPLAVATSLHRAKYCRKSPGYTDSF